MYNVEYDLDRTPWEAVLALVGFPGPPFGASSRISTIWTYTKGSETQDFDCASASRRDGVSGKRSWPMECIGGEICDFYHRNRWSDRVTIVAALVTYLGGTK